MAHGRNRSRRPARGAPTRGPRNRILVVCEGAITEKQYIEGFARFHREAVVRVDLAPGAGVPLSVVRRAKEFQQAAEAQSSREGDSFLRYDAVWCVFDVDEHPQIPEALVLVRQNGLRVAMSHPCFELWLVLHHRDSPGMIHRHDVQAMVKSFVPNYDKRVDYSDYQGGYERARARARKLDELAQSINDLGMNPTTGVYLLTEAIVTPEPVPPASTDRPRPRRPGRKAD